MISQPNLKTLFILFYWLGSVYGLPPDFQYKKWTSARARAKHGKLEARRCCVLCKASVQQKSGWSAKPPGTDAHVVSSLRPSAVQALSRHRVYVTVRSCACFDESGDRDRIKGLTSWEGSKINVNLQNSVTEMTGRGLLWHNRVWRRSANIFYWLLETRGSSRRSVWTVQWKF